jgi:hypothetical protein
MLAVLMSLSLLPSVACIGGELEEEHVGTTYKTFEQFEAEVYREHDTNVYIVDGDTPIETREQLRAFYEKYIQNAALIVHQVNGVDARWNDAQKLNLTYCVSTAFGSRYSAVVNAMANATAAWMAAANIRFIHQSGQDNTCTAGNNNVVFDVSPTSGQPYLARAFFPTFSRANRNILIDDSSFGPTGAYTLTGILRHELGHALGFRHEHTRPEAAVCFEDSSWHPLTSYDSASVMHYPGCNGSNTGDLVLTQMDQKGAAVLYGRANLALGKPTSQSSTLEPQANASRAVDGNIDGAYGGQSLTHTNNDFQAWWQVDLQSSQPIGNVAIFNRTDCCSDRLSNFKLMVSNDGSSWASFPYPGAAPAQVTFAVNRTARYVKVQLNGTNYLSLAEVQISASANLALGKTASQSSTLEPQANASRAVDGNIDGAYGGQSLTHTNNDFRAWWQVDLQSSQLIGNVVLFNRTDCCSDRLSNFKLMVSNDGSSWASFPYPGAAPAQVTFTLNTTARYLRVQLNGTNFLSLAEVQVFSPANLALGKPAIQSSTIEAQTDAARAVDGNINGTYDGYSLTHTSYDSQAWWQIDLQSSEAIGNVVLFNRTDCCSDRLSNFNLMVSDDGSSWSSFPYPGAAPAQVTFAVNRTARYVRVQLNGVNYLSLAEVQVFAP